MKDRVVIIGASITGVYTMNELVKKDFTGKITIIDKKDVFPYNPYPLPKEWMLDQEEIDPPLLMSKEYYEKHDIDLKLNTKVGSVNWKDKTIKTHKGETIPYDYLVIGTGSRLRKLSLPGEDAGGIFYLREYNHAREIKDWSQDIKDVVIIGTGFIGLEMASTFSQLDKNVSVLVRSGKPLEKVFGKEASDYFTKMHQKHNVNFMFNEETEEFIKNDKGNIDSIKTKSGKTINADMVIIAVGADPNLSLEIDSLDTDNGKIIVNEYGETSLEDIYAGGDVVLWPYKDKLIHVEHWENAWSQGISIAKNILKAKSNKYKVNPYFWTDQYNQTFEYLGNATSWDKTFIRGSLDEKEFTIAYLDNNNYPLAILFANESEKRGDINKLLNQNKPINEDKFRDIDTPIKEVLD